MKHSLRMTCACLAVAAFAFGAQAAGPDDVDFGDDSSLWANDGECDDPRFEGPGAATTMDDADTMADASDCKAAFLAGSVTLVGAASAPKTAASSTPLLNAMPARPSRPATASSDTIDYGDDDSLFALDGECDDARFIGAAMADGQLLADDIGHDASDCEAGMTSGELRLRGDGDPSIEEITAEVELSEEDQELLEELARLFEDLDSDTTPIDPSGFDDPPADGIVFNGINFGDDASTWSNDGECDDPRFAGTGQTTTTLLEADAYHDATDCLAAWKEGGLELVDF